MDSLRRLPTTTLSRRFARKIVNPSTPGMDNASIVASVIGDAGKTILGSVDPDTAVAKSLAADAIVAAAVSFTAAAHRASAIISELVSVPSSSDPIRSEFVILPISSNFGRGGAVMEFPPALLGFGSLYDSDALSTSLHFAPVNDIPAGLAWSRPKSSNVPIGVIHGQDLDVHNGCRSGMSDLKVVSLVAGNGFPAVL